MKGRSGPSEVRETKVGEGVVAARDQVCVIVTPIWQKELSGSDLQNVRRTAAVTAGIPHVFVAPAGLDVSFYQHEFPDSGIRRVRANAMNGLISYSRMMLSASFYEAFTEFEFMVLVQSDAFLTASPLSMLEREKYDYIGAPWLEPHTTSRFTNYFPRTLGRVETIIRAPDPMWVGNGGLSIRRIAPIISALRTKPLLARFDALNEDVVLSYLGGIGLIQVATASHAAAIFFERGETVPQEEAVLGFHALERYYPAIYADYSARWA